jgi:hypothetical protein
MMEELFTRETLKVNYLGVPYSELSYILLKQRFVFPSFARELAD